MTEHEERRQARVGLPPRPFLYTVDQIAGLLSITPGRVHASLHYDRRSVGKCPREKMLAHNIATEGRHPEWRIAERELVRWLRVKGFRYYDRGWIEW